MSEIDWDSLDASSRRSRLIQHLEAHVPRELWDQRNADGWSLMHLACRQRDGSDVRALLTRGYADVDACTDSGWTPLHLAVSFQHPLVVQQLCRAGADVRRVTGRGHTALEMAVMSSAQGCVVALLRQGERLETVSPTLERSVARLMHLQEAVDRGCARCRRVVVALLGLKRRRGPALSIVDRWVVREIAFAVLATRFDAAWPST